MFADILSNVALGLSHILEPQNLLYCVIGVVVGNLVGVIPGIGALAAISMLFPITFQLDPLQALVMLGGIYYGSTYGGAVAAILLNLPGTPDNAVACLDGYPMAQQGRAGVALFLSVTASFIGGSAGILMMMFFSPIIVKFAMNFGAAEYFALIIMGLIGASAVSTGSMAKSIAMIIVGVLFGLIGIDIYSSVPRFTFDMPQLLSGINLVALAMGLFGATEVISSVRTAGTGAVNTKITLRSMKPTADDIRRSFMPILRGIGIGAFIGALPGAGRTVAAFMSYAVEKKSSKEPWRFGKGAVEGIIGPETANNAADQTAFIPTMTLGIPGSPTMALMLGVLIIHGITPGPSMMAERPEMFWGLVMSFWVGNVLLLFLNIPLIGLWISVLKIPYHILAPTILMFLCIGVYTVNNSSFDVVSVAFFGALGLFMRKLDFPVAPLLLGFVLGPMMEEEFRRSMLLSRGSFSIFIERPLSLTFMLITLGILLWGIRHDLMHHLGIRRKTAIAED